VTLVVYIVALVVAVLGIPGVWPQLRAIAQARRLRRAELALRRPRDPAPPPARWIASDRARALWAAPDSTDAAAELISERRGMPPRGVLVPARPWLNVPKGTRLDGDS